MPWGTPLTLIGESAEQVDDAQRMLVRIGIDTLPPGQLWVHCASGYRASIAACLLDRAGRDVVFIDDSFDSAIEAGLTNQS
jgi:rhodanese-related sulfurtransferase